MKDYKRLGATQVIAATNTRLYRVPEKKQAVSSTVFAVNRGNVNRTFRIAVIPGEIEAVALEDYLYFDAALPRNETFTATLGLTLDEGWTIMVYASNAEVHFSAFGAEIDKPQI